MASAFSQGCSGVDACNLDGVAILSPSFAEFLTIIGDFLVDPLRSSVQLVLTTGQLAVLEELVRHDPELGYASHKAGLLIERWQVRLFKKTGFAQKDAFFDGFVHGLVCPRQAALEIAASTENNFLEGLAQGFLCPQQSVLDMWRFLRGSSEKQLVEL